MPSSPPTNKKPNPFLEEYYESLVEARSVNEAFLGFLLENQLSSDLLSEYDRFETLRLKSMRRVSDAKAAYFRHHGRPTTVNIPAEIAKKLYKFEENR